MKNVKKKDENIWLVRLLTLILDFNEIFSFSLSFSFCFFFLLLFHFVMNVEIRDGTDIFHLSYLCDILFQSIFLLFTIRVRFGLFISKNIFVNELRSLCDDELADKYYIKAFSALQKTTKTSQKLTEEWESRRSEKAFLFAPFVPEENLNISFYIHQMYHTRMWNGI